jgi:hypothetical protein
MGKNNTTFGKKQHSTRVYETQREYSEQHTYEYLNKEAIIDIATKYEAFFLCIFS